MKRKMHSTVFSGIWPHAFFFLWMIQPVFRFWSCFFIQNPKRAVLRKWLKFSKFVEKKTGFHLVQLWILYFSWKCLIFKELFLKLNFSTVKRNGFYPKLYHIKELLFAVILIPLLYRSMVSRASDLQRKKTGVKNEVKNA